jgi:hypothetical protein
MIPQFWSRFGVDPWGRHLIVAVALAATATGATPAADDANDDALSEPGRVSRLIELVGIDTPGDPGAIPPSAADSPTESSGPFDGVRGDLGEDDDLSEQAAARRRARLQRMSDQRRKAADAVGTLPDPLKGTPLMSPEKTGQDANKVLAKTLKPRSDTWADWYAPLEPLHRCGEPRALPPCVPPPPCHPSAPPAPYDLVGVQGVPSGGPIYEGPCQPRTGTHDHCPHPHVHRLSDRFFDAFYRWK